MFHHCPKRDHVIKIVITIGVFISTFIVLWRPDYTVHAGLLACATNVIWIWA